VYVHYQVQGQLGYNGKGLPRALFYVTLCRKMPTAITKAKWHPLTTIRKSVSRKRMAHAFSGRASHVHCSKSKARTFQRRSMKLVCEATTGPRPPKSALVADATARSLTLAAHLFHVCSHGSRNIRRGAQPRLEGAYALRRRPSRGERAPCGPELTFHARQSPRGSGRPTFLESLCPIQY
jgi:hypothetical protein